ncbi:unnamed protein product, partial [Closterium sp. NIES-53]
AACRQQQAAGHMRLKIILTHMEVVASCRLHPTPERGAHPVANAAVLRCKDYRFILKSYPISHVPA